MSRTPILAKYRYNARTAQRLSIFTERSIAILRVITGLGVGGILACSNVIASEYASQRWRGLAVSLQSTGYALGATIGGTIAVWLLSQYGWRSVFLFGGCATLAIVPLVLWRLPESLDFLLARRPANALERLNLGPVNTNREDHPRRAQS